MPFTGASSAHGKANHCSATCGRRFIHWRKYFLKIVCRAGLVTDRYNRKITIQIRWRAKLLNVLSERLSRFANVKLERGALLKPHRRFACQRIDGATVAYQSRF